MEKIDARKLSPRELSEKRRIAIKLREKGIANKEVAEIVGISAQTISTYYSQYKKDGSNIFKVKNAGRPKNVGKKLSDEQEAFIIKKLIDTTPQQLKFKFALWTREAVQTLIKYEIDVYMPISTVGYYLAKWKFTSKYSYVQTTEEIDDICAKASEEGKAMIFYTFVKKEMADHMMGQIEKSGLIGVDIYSPILTGLGQLFQLPAKEKPGINRQLNEDYFNRVEAIEFSVKYDDGRDPRGIEKADIVLVGVSRTSKTPLSIYLANKNVKVANIPLFPESKPPKEIFTIAPERIIGLVNSPKKLNEVRKERLKTLGLPPSASYAGMERILEELEYADEIMKQIGCEIVDVSNKAIEETADHILHYMDMMNISRKHL